MISKIAPPKFIPKKHPDIGGLETEDMKFRLEFFLHMLFYIIWTQYNIKMFYALNRNIFRVSYVLRAKFLKNQPERLQNWILQFSELYICGSINPRKLVFCRLKLLYIHTIEKKTKFSIYIRLLSKHFCLQVFFLKHWVSLLFVLVMSLKFGSPDPWKMHFLPFLTSKDIFFIAGKVHSPLWILWFCDKVQ